MWQIVSEVQICFDEAGEFKLEGTSVLEGGPPPASKRWSPIRKWPVSRVGSQAPNQIQLKIKEYFPL